MRDAPVPGVTIVTDMTLGTLVVMVSNLTSLMSTGKKPSRLDFLKFDTTRHRVSYGFYRARFGEQPVATWSVNLTRTQPATEVVGKRGLKRFKFSAPWGFNESPSLRHRN